MAFEMLPPSNVERRQLHGKAYSTLQRPFDSPSHEQPYQDYSDSPTLRPTPSRPDSSRSLSDVGAQTSYDAYGSRTHLNAGGGNGGYPQSTPTHGRPWQPGFLQQFPWLGMLALIGTVLCTFAAVVVLVISNGRPIENWSATLQPTVYISIFTALANILLTYALYQGIVISFWRKAGQGATLLELHQYWNSGSSFWGAIRGIVMWRGKMVAIACVATVLSILRGPLMQRASSVHNVLSHNAGNTTVHSAQQIPFGWAGTDTGRTSSPSFMNPNFTTVMQSYTNRDAMSLVHSDCGSSCSTSIKGFGFGVKCNMTGIKYSLQPAIDANGSVTDLPTVEAFSTSAGTIEVFGHGGSAELDYYGNPPNLTDPSTYQSPNYALLLNATFFQNATESYIGTMAQHLCALRAGVVSYPIIITNGTVNLQSSSWRNDTFLEDRGLAGLTYGGQSNIAGYVLAANNLYQSSATFQYGGAVSWILNLQGLAANQYLRRNTAASNNYYNLDANITWRDPMEDMINSMREIAFRSALDVANHNLTFPDSIQRVTYVSSQPQTVYFSNYRYMASAVAVSLLGVFAVLPTFIGWWELGRRVTLSPLEVAKAFDAPLLGSAESNAGAEQMLKEVGDRRVRYGDVTTGGVGRRLQILHAELVRPPVKGLRYS